MKKIIFMGDSLTWGQNPNIEGERWSKDIRWTSLVKKSITQNEVLSISVPGMAIKNNPWSIDDDWCNTDHHFIEKVLKSFEYEIKDVFLFFGANNYGAIVNKPKDAIEIKNLYQDLISSIKNSINGNFNIYVMLLPKMAINNGRFSLSDLNSELKKLKNINGIVDLSRIKITSKDGVHFTEENNSQVAKEVIDFIKAKVEYK